MLFGGVMVGQAGASSFAEPHIVSAGSEVPAGLAVTALPGDGNLDAVVPLGGDQDAKTAVLAGDGAGGLDSPVAHDLGTAAPVDVATGDLNHDGHDDVVVADMSGSVWTLLADPSEPDGLSEPAETSIQGISDLTAIAIGDWNTDTHPDVVVAGTFGESPVGGEQGVAGVLGDGTGQLDDEFTSPLVWGQQLVDVLIDDLGGHQGVADLAVANRSSDEVALADLDSIVDQDTPPNLDTFAVGDGPAALASGDLNGDSRTDLVVANEGDDSVSVLLGNANGLAPAKAYQVLASSPVAVGIGDMDLDGTPDIVTTNRDSGDVSVLPGRGDGTFADAQQFATGPSVGRNSLGLALADMNRDSRIDVVTVGTNTTDVSVLLNNTSAGFAPDPAALAFGSVVLGQTRSLQLEIANPLEATGPLVIHEATPTGPAASAFAVDPDGCAAAVAPGDSCTINVSFTPEEAGNAEAQLTVETNIPGGDGSHTVALSGEVVAPGNTVTPTSVEFGEVTVGSSEQITLEVRNPASAGADLAIGSVTLNGDSSFSITDDRCSGTRVPVGELCMIEVAFKPAGEGARTGQIKLETNVPGTPEQTVPVSGTGVAQQASAGSSISFPPARVTSSASAPPSPTPSPTTPAAATASLDGTIVDVDDRGIATVPVACSGADGQTCAGDLNLSVSTPAGGEGARSAGSRSLGATRVSVPAGETGIASVRLNATGRRLVSRRARTRARVTLRTGGAQTRSARVTLVAAHAPRATVRTRTAVADRAGRVRLTVACAATGGRCTGRLTLRGAGTAATRAIAVGSGERATVSVTLPRRTRARLARGARLRLRAKIATSIPVGISTTTRRPVTIVAGARPVVLTG
jgi:hypothetical protein